MDLRGTKLSDTYRYLLSTSPSTQSITLGDGSVVPWDANGVVIKDNVAQTINGPKTFTNLTIPNTVNFASNGSIVKNGNHVVTLTTSSTSNITFSSSTARTYTMQDPGANASFVMTEGSQTINGAKTFNGDFSISNSTVNIVPKTIGTNKVLQNAQYNYWGSSATGLNTFGDRVIAPGAYNEFGYISRSNSFGQGAGINEFGSLATGYNNFGNGLNGVGKNNSFGNNLVNGAINYFGYNSKNIFGENGQNYFYSGSFAGPITMPATISYTSNGSITKEGNHSLKLITTNNTTGTFPTGTFTIASLNNEQIFSAQTTFSSGVNITKTTDQLVFGSTQKTTITSPTPASGRTYTIADVGGNASFVMTEGNQTIAGSKTFSKGIVIQSVSNQIQLKTGLDGNSITITAPSISANRVYTVPDAGGNCDFVMTTGGQTISGAKSFAVRPQVNGSGVLLVGEAVAGSATPYSLTFSSGIKDGDFTWNGSASKTIAIDTNYAAVLTGNQTVNGKKTFKDQLIINTGSNQLLLRTGDLGGSVAISLPSIANDLVYTVPDIGAHADFVMTKGTQSISGFKSFQSRATFQSLGDTPIRSQIALKTGTNLDSNTLFIMCPSISVPQTYTIPDIGGSASFIMSSGNQNISGLKNFGTRPTINGVDVMLKGDTSAFTKIEATNLVYNTGAQTISGSKRFTTGISFISTLPSSTGQYGTSGEVTFGPAHVYRHNGIKWQRASLAFGDF